MDTDSSVRRLAQAPEVHAALADVRVLYTDLDGTMLARGGLLLGDADGRPWAGVADAIVALNAAELRVVMVSGRNRLQLTEAARLLGWRDFIAEAGAIIVRGTGPGSVVEYNTGEWGPEMLPLGMTPFEAIDGSGAYEALRAAFPGRIEHHSPWHHGREASHLLRGELDLTAAQAVLNTLELPVDILDNGVIRPPAHTLSGVETVHAYHLVPRGVSKAQALSLDLAESGLARSQAAAIGDSATDLAMADAVQVLALVANALESPVVRERLAVNVQNAVICERSRGEGWAEFAQAWLAARG